MKKEKNRSQKGGTGTTRKESRQQPPQTRRKGTWAPEKKGKSERVKKKRRAFPQAGVFLHKKKGRIDDVNTRKAKCA